MAKREALRELQSRLAERLQAAQSAGQAAAWLAVECQQAGFLFPLSGAGEIFALPTLLPVSHTAPWFLGAANLRGRVHGVVDFAAFLGLRPPVVLADLAREQARVLSLNPALGSHAALLVDRLAGLRNPAQLQPVPQEPGIEQPAFATGVWQDTAGRRWQGIDLSALSAHPHFLAIAAA